MLFALALAGATTLGPITGPAGADSLPSASLLRPTPATVTLTKISLPAVRPLPSPAVRAPQGDSADAEPQPQLIEYSDAYFKRLTIHRWASYLTVPLFAAQYVVGNKLMNGQATPRLRNLHRALAVGLAGLFGVNTITGGLNLMEGWKDPEGRTRRTIHSALMLLSDAGFVATGLTVHGGEEDGFYRGPTNFKTHRSVAYASMGAALLGYAIMLPIFGRD